MYGIFFFLLGQFYDASPRTVTAKINFTHPFWKTDSFVHGWRKKTCKAFRDMSNKQELIHVQTTSKLMRKKKKKKKE